MQFYPFPRIILLSRDCIEQNYNNSDSRFFFLSLCCRLFVEHFSFIGNSLLDSGVSPTLLSSVNPAEFPEIGAPITTVSKRTCRKGMSTPSAWQRGKSSTLLRHNKNSMDANIASKSLDPSNRSQEDQETVTYCRHENSVKASYYNRHRQHDGIGQEIWQKKQPKVTESSIDSLQADASESCSELYSSLAPTLPNCTTPPTTTQHVEEQLNECSLLSVSQTQSNPSDKIEVHSSCRRISPESKSVQNDQHNSCQSIQSDVSSYPNLPTDRYNEEQQEEQQRESYEGHILSSFGESRFPNPKQPVNFTGGKSRSFQ